MSKKDKVTPIKATEQEVQPEFQKAIMVMALNGYLLVQPNFDVPAGSVLQVLPQSGTQMVGRKASSEGTSESDG